MTNLQINQMLAQMRAMAAQAGIEPPAAAGVQPAQQGGGFADMLKNAVNSVNQQQTEATAKADALMRGEDVSLTDVMISLQKSRVSFEAVKQVRNRLLEAYQEISRMQV